MLESIPDAMIAYDLQCSQGHLFEGWFDDEQAFRQQQESGLVTCPVCNDAVVERIPSTFANAHSYALFMVATIPWILGEIVGQWRLSFVKMTGLAILSPGFVCALAGIFIAGPRQPVVTFALIVF